MMIRRPPTAAWRIGEVVLLGLGIWVAWQVWSAYDEQKRNRNSRGDGRRLGKDGEKTSKQKAKVDRYKRRKRGSVYPFRGDGLEE